MITRSTSARLGASSSLPPSTSSPWPQPHLQQQRHPMQTLARADATAATNAHSPSSGSKSVRWGDAGPSSSSSSAPTTAAFPPTTPAHSSALVRHPATPPSHHSTAQTGSLVAQQQAGAVATTPSFSVPASASASSAISVSGSGSGSYLTPQRDAAGVPVGTSPLRTVPTSSSQQAPTQQPQLQLAKALSSSMLFSSNTPMARRVKWNVAALAIKWILPAVWSKPTEIYWDFLDAIHYYCGGNSDEIVDGLIDWISWLVSIVLVTNLVEALAWHWKAAPSVLTQPGRAIGDAPGPSGGLLTIAEKQAQGQPLHASSSPATSSPATQRSLGFAQLTPARGSPKTRPSSISAASSPLRAGRSGTHPSPKKPQPQQQHHFTPGTPVQDYSVFSPAGSSLNGGRSKRLMSGGQVSPFSSHSPGGSPSPSAVDAHGGRRLPSTAYSSSSPLAAYRARNASERTSLGRSPSAGGYGGYAFERDGEEEEDGLGGSAAMGDDSFEVERALRSLSQGLPWGEGTGREGRGGPTTSAGGQGQGVGTPAR